MVANASYKCAIESSGTSHLHRCRPGTYNATFTAQVLSILVQDKWSTSASPASDLPEPATPTPRPRPQLDVADGTSQLVPRLWGLAHARRSPACYRAQLVRFQVDEDASRPLNIADTSLEPGCPRRLRRPPTRTRWLLACVSVIEVGSEATAAVLADPAWAGASFAALAKADSVDTTRRPTEGRSGAFPTRTSPPRSTPTSPP